MKHKTSHRLVALALAVCTIIGLVPLASAASIADGSKTATISHTENISILPTNRGNILKAAGYTYTTNDGLSGPAYCIDYGLSNTTKTLPITGKYSSHPAAAGVFANGYPQHSLATFNELYLASNPILAGLTEEEYRYATQIAVWASLGQLGVDGTAFTAGRATVPQPSGDLRQMRVFRAVQLILQAASTWDRIYYTGMYIRTDEDKLGGNVAIPTDMTLDFAADNNRYGIKREVINGVSYYTKEYIFASATSTYYNGYTLELWTTGAPSGTIFTDISNKELAHSSWRDTQTWRLPVSESKTEVNANGFEYSGRAKLCIPVNNAPPLGEITLRCAAQITQYDIYLAYNETASEQSYIIADPSKGSLETSAVLTWGGPGAALGAVLVTKVGAGGSPLEGAEFELSGTDGTLRTGKTDSHGEITWMGLSPSVEYTLAETSPPAGYAVAEPQTVRVTAANTTYITVRDDTQHTLTVRKVDRQSGYSLRGAVIAFEQIDGSFKTARTTDHAGIIQMDAEQLPIGSYKVYEKVAPSGYQLDKSEQTVHWSGKQDMTLTFTNVRKPTLIIAKRDSRTGYSLDGAVFDVFKDGAKVTTVTSSADGCAYVHDISGGYYEVREVSAPDGYVADGKLHGVKVDLYDPATTDDPMLVIENDRKPSLRIVKTDAVSGDPIAGAKFHIVYASNNTFSGEINDLGSYTTDEGGLIELTRITDGWYRITETEPAAGYALGKQPTQDVYVKAGTGRVVTFENTPLSALVIKKVDATNGEVLQGAKFRVRYFEGVSGTGGTVIGEYETSVNGTVVVTGLKAGTYIVEEIAAPDGYTIDDAPKTVYLSGKEQTVVTVEFADQPESGLIITKLDADTKKPLSGSVFEVKTDSGAVVGSSNGRFTTDASGVIHLPNLASDTYIVREVSAPRGYVLDSTPQTVKLRHGETHKLTFYNERIPEGSLRITKLDEETRQPISGVQFRVTEISGRYVGTYRTNSRGIVNINGLNPGWYTVTETEAADGYELDAEPRDIEVRNGETAVLEVTNRLKGSALIHKVDSITGKGIYGVLFLLSDARGNPIGQYTSDQNGYVYIDGELKDGKYTVREIQAAEGYLPDTTAKTLYVEYGGCPTITWYNTPIRGQIQITKTSADYNSTNGCAAGTPIPGCEFELYDHAGNLADTVQTDRNGVAISAQLPLGRYKVVESKAADFYLLDGTPIDVEIEYAGQIVRVAATNESVKLGVSIVKTGYHEVMGGQEIRYTLSKAANDSNVPLQSFYFRDTLPTSAVRLNRIVTGTYSAGGSYKVLYRTNLSGEQYRVLADSLSTRQSYTLDASPGVLKLAANEYVTEVFVSFGTVPAGFHAVTAPRIDCTVLPNLQNGTAFTNVADVGGQYGGKWVQQDSKWSTSVYAPTKPLPKTGY